MADKLKEYQQKRDFNITNEPEGQTEKLSGRLRFVIQHHSARSDHYDLRLEWEGVMLSWAVPKGPSFNPRDKRLAVQVEDHPLDYRNFEGIIPEKEYGGGVVMIWDEGFWEPQADAGKALEDGDFKFILHGKRLKGNWVLVRMKPKIADSKKNWLLIKEKDEFVQNSDGIFEFATSIRTGRTMEEILQGKEQVNLETKNPFKKTNVQLAKLVDHIPEGDWLFEVKFDGYRIVAYVEGDNTKLVTRNGQDYTGHFKDITNALTAWAEGNAMVLDGEMVVLDAQGKPNFQALQNYLKKENGQNLVYMVFDVLALNGADLRNLRLIDRKDKLQMLLKNAPANIRFTSHSNGNGESIYKAACQAGLEGIIGKKADSVYSGIRNGDWVKMKCINEQEFVIGGYTVSAKKSSGISSILLGVYEKNELVYAGRAGTGLTLKSMKELENQFKSMISSHPAFKDAPTTRNGESIIWLKPFMVAQIAFAEWTKDNLLRQASFKGLRSDKNPKDVKRESSADGLDRPDKPDAKKTEHMNVIVSGIEISNPDKVIYDEPHITKKDISNYYLKVSARMLPFVGNRILSVIRCPSGIAGKHFLKKHPDKTAKGIIKIPVTENDGEIKDYFYIDTLYGLIFEVQMNTIEFHTWGSRVSQMELPDTMVFDLDPGDGLSLGELRQGVKDLKKVLNELSLVSFLKTSGGKGYHIVIPLNPSVGWEAFSAFAKRVAEVMAQRWPDRYTSNMRKDHRKGKIFIDWIRNSRGATSVAPYSLRARKGAAISMPIKWEELDVFAPDAINIQTAFDMVDEEDPWQDYFNIRQRIKGEKL